MFRLVLNLLSSRWGWGTTVGPATQALEAAMALPGVRTALTPQQRQRLGRRVVEPSLHERATVYLLLAEVLSRLSKMPDAPEAKKVRGGGCWVCV